MTEQQPNGGDAPADKPEADQPEADQPAKPEAAKPAGDKPAARERPARPATKPVAENAEGAQPPAERPARHGPPIAVAEEVLNEQGQKTAATLAKALGTMIVEKGGREDMPWVRVEAKDLHRAAERCRDGELKMDMLHLQLAVDWSDHLQMIYVLYSVPTNRKVILRADVPAEDPKIGTVTDLWEAASWYERETHDLFGVVFEGNDDLAPLLLYPEFEGHPGLKSFPLHDYQEF
jgi:NADH-quinone oxidoreductase subunit C